MKYARTVNGPSYRKTLLGPRSLSSLENVAAVSSRNIIHFKVHASFSLSITLICFLIAVDRGEDWECRKNRIRPTFLGFMSQSWTNSEMDRKGPQRRGSYAAAQPRLVWLKAIFILDYFHSRFHYIKSLSPFEPNRKKLCITQGPSVQVAIFLLVLVKSI